jgi:hypothetical protein
MFLRTALPFHLVRSALAVRGRLGMAAGGVGQLAVSDNWPAEFERLMRAEPGVVLADVLHRTGGVYDTTTCLTPKFREDIREIAELTSDDHLLWVAELAEVPVSLEHLRHVDPQTRILVGYRLDVTPAESPRLRRRLALPPDPTITLRLDEVPFPDAPGRSWAAMRRDPPGLNASGRSAAYAQ